MKPFLQIVLSLVLEVIMVCDVTTQTATTITKQLTPQPTVTTELTETLTYECFSNETIRLLGSAFVKPYVSLLITVNTNSHINCTATKANDGGFLIEGTGCFNNLLRGNLRAEKNSNIIGGKESREFTFECNGLPKNGTIKTVTQKVSQIASGATQRPVITLSHQFLSFDLQLTVTDKSNTTAMSFVDGDLEVLHIKGPEAYYMYLQECIAFKGTNVDSSKTNHTLYKDFAPVDSAIIDKAKDKLQGEITVNVYAFHFVGSSDVTYQCTILICPDNTCRSETSGRKRRDTSLKSEQVEASVKVFDKYDLTVSSADKTGSALFLIASITLLTVFL